MISLHIWHNRRYVDFFSVIFDFCVEIMRDSMSDCVDPSRSHIELCFDFIKHVNIAALVSWTYLLVRKILFEK